MSQLERSNRGSSEGDVARSWNGDAYGYPKGHTGQPAGTQSAWAKAEQVLDLLLRRWWIVLLTCILAVGGAAYYAYSQIPVYRTSSLVLVDEQKRAPVKYSEVEGAGEEFARSNRSLQNELIILRHSRSLRKGVAERLLNQGNAGQLFVSGGESGVDRAIGRIQEFLGVSASNRDAGEGQEASASGGSSASSSRDGGSISADRIAAVLPGYVRFAPAGGDTDAIRIIAEHSDPRVAALLANLYMREYLELTRKASRAQLSASREFIEKQVEKRRQELRAVEEEIREYQSQRGAMSLDQESSNLVSRISQVEAQRDEARVELRMKKASLQSLQEELDSIRPEQLSQRLGSGIRAEIEALQQEIAQFELSKQRLMLESNGALSSADSAQLGQIEGRIRSLKATVDSLSDAYVDQTMATGGLSAEGGVQRVETLRRQIAEQKIDVAGLEARIGVLTDRLQEYEAELRSIPKQSMELAQLERRQNYAEQMYESAVQKLQEARVQEESELGYADGVAEASMPGQPVEPQPRRTLMLGLLLGLLGGGGLALLRDRLDNRLYKPDRIREMGYHEVGVIPNLAPLIRDQFGGKATVERDGHLLETSLVSATKPQSAAAEAYRHIRTNVLFGRLNSDVQALLVTSPGAGDGKSVTAANLAIAMASAGRSTLLIDADLRRPRVHKLFGISQSPGLTEALQNSMSEQVRRPSIENLSILPAGSSVDRPSELLGSDQFRKLLTVARDRFDFVVIDTPPVMAATDAMMLSTQCDATLCVVRAATTTEPELEHAMEALDEVGANVLGTVLNGFDVSMAYGYKYRYRNYDRYGPYDQYQSLPPTTAG